MNPKTADVALDWHLSERFRIHTLSPELQRNGWPALLQHWGALINDYCYLGCTTENDVPYWYGERPLTGLLATAAWLTPDGWSLEEFSSVRGAAGDTGRGRGDLWLGMGRASYTIEAKITWPVSSTSQAIQEVKEQLRKASHQLKSLDRAYSEGRHVAICYAVPAFHPSVSNGIDTFTDRFFKGMAASFKGDAWVVASYRRPAPPADPESRQKRFYPGVILVGQVQPTRSGARKPK